MNNKASSTIAPASPRLVLLSHSELLDSALRQHLLEQPRCNLQRTATLRAEHAQCELLLIDLGSFSHEDCLQLLRKAGDTPIALINALPEQAHRLVEQHPWIRGVFYRSTLRSNFISGIRALLAGSDWLPRALMEKLLLRYRQLTHSDQCIDTLTLREKQILVLAGKGLSNAAIGEKLHLSTHTIKSHIHNALRKLGANNRAQGASIILAHVCEPES
ncbi:LuxR family DNA-binding response regulator [Stutzerimonas stutzeri TS44]|nr:LuxR family DNA-binding response regulator [Stutzerimonas stutzeri TS44]